MKQVWILCTALLLTASTACAASFDCTKATTKVEKMICANAGLSKLDGELGKAYFKVLKTFHGMPSIRQKQREWLKKRNKCGEVECLKSRYQERIAVLKRVRTPSKQELQRMEIFAQARKKGEGRYGLLMSKDDELCKHMLGLFNGDLKKYGARGDAHQEEHEEFKRVLWKPGKFSDTIGANAKIEYEPIEGALFDFNNDGVDDFVVRWKAWLSNVKSDYLFVLAGNMADSLNHLDFKKDLLPAPDQIYLAGYSYPLSRLPKTMAGQVMIDSRVLEPFIYRGTSYLLMRPLFEVPKIRPGYAVIAKYQKGKFLDRNFTGKMEDMCYYTRTVAARKD